MVREKYAGNLIWLREADQFSRLSAGDVLKSRLSGPRELVRRLEVPGVEPAMAMFDELARWWDKQVSGRPNRQEFPFRRR